MCGGRGEGWRLLSLRSRDAASEDLPCVLWDLVLRGVLTPQLLLPHPSSSNHEADQFSNARPNAGTIERARQTASENGERARSQRHPAMNY